MGRISASMGPALLAATGALAAANWYLQPERPIGSAALALAGGMALVRFIAGRWAGSAADRQDARNAIDSATGFAALMLALPLTARLGATFGAVDSVEFSRRSSMVVCGVFLASMGNAIPKTLTPLSALRCDAARVQSFQRFSGWTWVLIGLTYSAIWLALPLPLAKPVSMVVLAAGMAAVGIQLAGLCWPQRRSV